MAADLYNLANIQPLDLNTTGLNNSSIIVTTIFETTYQAVGDVWFFIGIWSLFILFGWLFYRREENFGFDVSRSLAISSTFCLIISIAVLLSGWIKSVYPLFWFTTIVFISTVGVYAMKQKGQ